MVSRMRQLFLWAVVPIVLLLVYAKYVDFRLRHVALYGHFCGPANGHNYSKIPKDGVDELCRTHDACIEEGLIHVDVIPLRSHRVPEFGCTIMKCDGDFVKAAKASDENQMCGAWKGYTVRRLYCHLWAWLGTKYHESKGT